MIGLVFIAHILMGAVFAWRFHLLPPQIPLFYSLPSGEDQLVEWWMIFAIPIIMDAIVVLNSVLIHFIPFQEVFVRKMLRITTVVAVILCTYLFIRIIILVT